MSDTDSDPLGDAIAAAVIRTLPDRPTFIHELPDAISQSEYDAFADSHGEQPCPDCRPLGDPITSG